MKLLALSAVFVLTGAVAAYLEVRHFLLRSAVVRTYKFGKMYLQVRSPFPLRAARRTHRLNRLGSFNSYSTP